jgi:hypothetical protein
MRYGQFLDVSKCINNIIISEAVLYGLLKTGKLLCELEGLWKWLYHIM